MTRVFVAALVIVIFVLSGIGYVLYEQTAIAPNTIKLALGFTPNGEYAPVYYGVARGIYRQHGVNLTVIPESSHTGAISSLVAGGVDFALVSPKEVVDYAAHNNAADLVMVASAYARDDLAVVYNAASITSISDLEGKSGAMLSPAAGSIRGAFGLFAEANHLNVSSMNLQYDTVTTSDDLLLSGSVQFIVVAIQNLGEVQAAGYSKGLTFGYFVMSERGFVSAGDALVTTRAMVQQHPDVVRDFVDASMQSLVSAYSDQAAAVRDLVTANPQLNETATLKDYQNLLACCSLNPTNQTNPLQYGWMDPRLMQLTVNNEIIADNLNVTLNATSIYTDEFVQQP